MIRGVVLQRLIRSARNKDNAALPIDRTVHASATHIFAPALLLCAREHRSCTGATSWAARQAANHVGRGDRRGLSDAWTSLCNHIAARLLPRAPLRGTLRHLYQSASSFARWAGGIELFLLPCLSPFFDSYLPRAYLPVAREARYAMTGSLP